MQIIERNLPTTYQSTKNVNNIQVFNHSSMFDFTQHLKISENLITSMIQFPYKLSDDKDFHNRYRSPHDITNTLK